MCTHVSGHSYMTHSDTDKVHWHMPESPKALISDTNTSGSQTADPELLINYCVRWFSCENCWGICAYSHYTQVYTLKAATQTAHVMSHINSLLFVCIVHVKHVFSQCWSKCKTATFIWITAYKLWCFREVAILFISFISCRVANLKVGDLFAHNVPSSK